MTRVGLRCDAGPLTGVGHLSRCLALAEEFSARGHDPVLLADLDGLDWARRQVNDLGVPLLPGPTTPTGMAAAAVGHGLDLIVMDSYELDPACGQALRGVGVRTLAVVDGDTRGQYADVYVDPNLQRSPVAVPEGSILLAGLRYALLRDRVRRRRPSRPHGAAATAAATAAAPAAPPTVLCFFGGTDAFGAAPVLTELLLETGEPMTVTVVAGEGGGRAALSRLRTGPAQQVTVIEPVDDLPALVVDADVVVCAAGTSMWELLCLGASVAVVRVAENQRHGFEPVVSGGFAAGLGSLAELVAGGRASALGTLSRLMCDPGTRRALSSRGWHAVDGEGRRRVVDVVLTVIGVDQPESTTSHLAGEQAG